MSDSMPQQFQGKSLPYFKCSGLLTAGERRFFLQGLKPAIGERYLISFKVRLADVITVEDWQSIYGRKIAQKHLDFVLISPKTTRIVAAIELNDATHHSPERRRRDAFIGQALQSASVPLVTYPIYKNYQPGKIRRRIFTAIARNRSARHPSKSR